MNHAWLLLLGCALPLAAPARAQELIGIDFVLGEVYRVDAKTGESSYVGYTGMDTHLWHSMAKDSTGRIVAGYGDDSHPYGIYEIDPNTGHASLVVQTDRVDLLALAFGPNGELYAMHEQQIPSDPEDLYLVDLITGRTTLIGTTGFRNLQALAYGQGRLWGWDGDVGLVTVDVLTGQATDVNPGMNDPIGLIQTLCFSDDDVLYAGFYDLYVVDTVTGALSFINLIEPTYPFLCGMEFLPNQPAPFSLGVSGETGGPMGAFAAGATPGGEVAFFATRGGGGPTRILPGRTCAGVELDLNQRLRLIGLAAADAAGRAEIGPVSVPGYPAGTLRLQALDLRTCSTSNRARVLY